MDTQQLLEDIKRKQKALQTSEAKLEAEKERLLARLQDYYGEDTEVTPEMLSPKMLKLILGEVEMAANEAYENLERAKAKLEKLWAAMQEATSNGG